MMKTLIPTLLLLASSAHAATHDGKNIDGHPYPCKATIVQFQNAPVYQGTCTFDKEKIYFDGHDKANHEYKTMAIFLHGTEINTLFTARVVTEHDTFIEFEVTFPDNNFTQLGQL